MDITKNKVYSILMAYELYSRIENGKVHIKPASLRKMDFLCGNRLTDDYQRIYNLRDACPIKQKDVIINDEELLKFFCTTHKREEYEIIVKNYQSREEIAVELYNFCGRCMSSIIGEDDQIVALLMYIIPFCTIWCTTDSEYAHTINNSNKDTQIGQRRPIGRLYGGVSVGRDAPNTTPQGLEDLKVANGKRGGVVFQYHCYYIIAGTSSAVGPIDNGVIY